MNRTRTAEQETEQAQLKARQKARDEAAEAAEFAEWCKTWDKWFPVTVKWVGRDEQPPQDPAWCRSVYGGSRN